MGEKKNKDYIVIAVLVIAVCVLVYAYELGQEDGRTEILKSAYLASKEAKHG